jgi:outer membrane biosynthesis protein TonB
MTLSLKKTDAADGSALEGAQFRLVKLALNADGSVSTKDPTVVAEDLVTNSKGLLKYTAARSAGIYEFQETKAPKGYTLDGALGTASHEVTIEDGDADVTVPVISFTDAKIPVAPPTTTTKTITPPVATTPITPTTPATPSTPKVATPSTPVVTPKTPRTPAPAVPKVTEAVPTPQKSTATPVTPTPKKSTATPQKTAPKTSGSSVAVLATTGSSVDAVAIATVLFIVAGAAATAFRKSGVQKR